MLHTNMYIYLDKCPVSYEFWLKDSCNHVYPARNFHWFWSHCFFHAFACAVLSLYLSCILCTGKVSRRCRCLQEENWIQWYYFVLLFFIYYTRSCIEIYIYMYLSFFFLCYFQEHSWLNPSPKNLLNISMFHTILTNIIM